MIRTFYLVSFVASLLLVFSLAMIANAQQSNITWQRAIEDYPNNIKVAASPDGSVGIICTNAGFPRPTELTKLGIGGSLLWRSQIRGTGADPSFSYIAQLYLLTATRDGGFLILCRETLGGTYRRYVITKFNSAGEQIWIEPLADYYESYVQGVTEYKAVIEGSDGSILLAGSRTNTRVYAPFIKRYTSLGKFDIDFQVGGSSFYGQVPSAIGITALTETNNGYAVCGIYGPTLYGPSAGTVRFINKEGVLVNTVNFSNELTITNIAFDPTDNSLVATSRNSQEWGVLKFNNAGEIQFRSVIPRKTNENTAFIEVAQNPCEGYIIADSDSTTSANFRITRISRDGGLLSSQIFGGQQADYVQGVALQSNGNIVLAGIWCSR